MTVLIVIFTIGWVAAAALGSQAYFRGEQSKPIHARNWRSDSFEKLAVAMTGQDVDYAQRVPGFDVADAYASNLLPDA
jgi:hypothetical protein